MSGPPWTARRALSDGLRAAGLWYGSTALVLAWTTTALIHGSPSTLGLLAVTAAVVALGGLVFVLPAPPRVGAVVVLAAVVVMAAGFTATLVVVARSPLPPGSTAGFPLSPVKTAMLAFAVNAGRRRAPLLAGAALAVVVETVCAVLGPALGVPWAFDLPEAATLALVALASSGFLIAGRRTEQPRRASKAAAFEEALTRTRSIARSRAAAVVHDTVLGDLAAVAAVGPGRLTPAAARRLGGTLELLASPDWAAPAGGEPAAVGGPVLAAIERTEAAGLSVRLDGELAELGGLAPDVEAALAAAVEQCLVNTRTHAGTDVADVTVLADRDGLTVMVADSGSGFDPEAVDRDRLGISTAVRARVEEVGGAVRVFAQPGVGTTVLLTVPKGGAA
ncbi:sensor histidine kinase [Amnibacterium kyonggiense]|uniref:Signal transduction histidine kinase n=1 Tax=Amnibacterium kyonggiense TaxID=595671 RepID=A0A4V3EAZ6_9MICO|nr:ATP-binding protein [Amnibacterium kyonggiense]TDS79764.1 signal transduction histidine kinase [Amnibacterium kyonggiense]